MRRACNAHRLEAMAGDDEYEPTMYEAAKAAGKPTHTKCSRTDA